MDDCTIAGAVGKRGSGKTTLLKTLVAGRPRVLFWDWRHEYEGQVFELRELPELLKRKTFRAVYRPGQYDLVQEFDALAHVVKLLARDCALVVDEVALVTPGYREGGIGFLLRYSRPSRIDLYWATQRPTRIPGVLLSELNELHVFHLHHRADLQALAGILDQEQIEAVRALREHEYLTVRF